METLKIILYVNAWGEKKNSRARLICSEWRELIDNRAEIDFHNFGGFLDGEKLKNFLSKCDNADIIFLDAWNRGGRDDAFYSMAHIARTILDSNPNVILMAQKMENNIKPVHEYAFPFDYWAEKAITPYIELALSKKEKKEEHRKVLVLDDSPIHRQSAIYQLKDNYNLTVTGTYYCAEKLLIDKNFDIFLSDLLMPASSRAQGKGEIFVGKEMPLGSILGFLALYRGIKNIAVITDTNHHDHPAAAALDCFPFNEPFTIGPAKVLLGNYEVPMNEGKNWKIAIDILEGTYCPSSVITY